MPFARSSFDIPARPSPDEIAALLPTLPASPNALPQLCRLVREGEPSLEDLRSFLRLDPGMSSRTLQMANQMAAVHGWSCPSIDTAADFLGARRIADLVTRVAKTQVLARPANLYGFDADELWRRSVSCALAAELLAELTGEDPDTAYTAGLLHAVGLVAIDEWARDKAPALLFMARDGSDDFRTSEVELLGCTQAEVSAAVLRRWGLPDVLTETIRWQNKPENAPAFSRLASLLHAAKWLRTVVCLDDDYLAPPLPAPSGLRPLGLTAERLCRFVVEVRIRLGEVRNRVENTAA